MNPPTLPFIRHLRSSHDVALSFTPSSGTLPEAHHPRAHIFILSDLFLVAEWMDATDKAAKAVAVARDQPERVGMGGPMPEMWLCYPPLAGKHLVVAEGSQGEFPLHSSFQRLRHCSDVLLPRWHASVVRVRDADSQETY